MCKLYDWIPYSGIIWQFYNLAKANWQPRKKSPNYIPLILNPATPAMLATQAAREYGLCKTYRKMGKAKDYINLSQWRTSPLVSYTLLQCDSSSCRKLPVLYMLHLEAVCALPINPPTNVEQAAHHKKKSLPFIPTVKWLLHSPCSGLSLQVQKVDQPWHCSHGKVYKYQAPLALLTDWPASCSHGV